MSFTYNLATDVGRLRLRLGDTNSEIYVFEDAELTEFLTTGTDLAGGVREAIQTLMVSKAHRIKRATSMGLTIDDTEQVKELRAILAGLGGTVTLPTVSVTFPARLPSDQGYNELTRG